MPSPQRRTKNKNIGGLEIGLPITFIIYSQWVVFPFVLVLVNRYSLKARQMGKLF